MKLAAFGEIMMRFSPSDPGERLFTSNEFKAQPGGSEANVAVALSSLGIKTSFISKIPREDNSPFSKMVIDYFNKYRVETENIIFDNNRLGLYFTETGISQRPSLVFYDRKYSSFSLVRDSDFNWKKIFSGCNWFHSSGIVPAISKGAAECLVTAMKGASRRCTVSFDLNYRGKLWDWVEDRRNDIPKLMNKICSFCDVISGNETDFHDIFRFDASIDYNTIARKIFIKFPRLKYIAISMRDSISATHNKWSGKLFFRGKQNKIMQFNSYEYNIDSVVDRVGTGDAFTAGIIFGIEKYNNDFQKIIDFAVALSCLKHSTRGDSCNFSEKDILAVIKNKGSGRIVR